MKRRISEDTPSVGIPPSSKMAKVEDDCAEFHVADLLNMDCIITMLGWLPTPSDVIKMRSVCSGWNRIIPDIVRKSFGSRFRKAATRLANPDDEYNLIKAIETVRNKTKTNFRVFEYPPIRSVGSKTSKHTKQIKKQIGEDREPIEFQEGSDDDEIEMMEILSAVVLFDDLSHFVKVSRNIIEVHRFLSWQDQPDSMVVAKEMDGDVSAVAISPDGAHIAIVSKSPPAKKPKSDGATDQDGNDDGSWSDGDYDDDSDDDFCILEIFTFNAIERTLTDLSVAAVKYEPDCLFHNPRTAFGFVKSDPSRIAMVNMGMLIIWDVHTGSIQSASDIDVAWGYSLTLQNFVIIDSNLVKKVDFNQNSLVTIAELPFSARVSEASLLDTENVLLHTQKGSRVLNLKTGKVESKSTGILDLVYFPKYHRYAQRKQTCELDILDSRSHQPVWYKTIPSDDIDREAVGDRLLIYTVGEDEIYCVDVETLEEIPINITDYFRPPERAPDSHPDWRMRSNYIDRNFLIFEVLGYTLILDFTPMQLIS